VLHFDFHPNQLGTESASYTLKTNDGSVTIDLRGTGVATHRDGPLQRGDDF
jgi:hypothetical protein